MGSGPGTSQDSKSRQRGSTPREPAKAEKAKQTSRLPAEQPLAGASPASASNLKTRGRPAAGQRAHNPSRKVQLLPPLPRSVNPGQSRARSRKLVRRQPWVRLLHAPPSCSGTAGHRRAHLVGSEAAWETRLGSSTLPRSANGMQATIGLSRRFAKPDRTKGRCRFDSCAFRQRQGSSTGERRFHTPEARVRLPPLVPTPGYANWKSGLIQGQVILEVRLLSQVPTPSRGGRNRRRGDLKRRWAPKPVRVQLPPPGPSLLWRKWNTHRLEGPAG